MKQSKIIHYFLSLIILCSLIFIGCNNGNKNKKEEAKDTTKVDSTKLIDSRHIIPKGDRKYNDIARLLAGLPMEDSSELKALHESKKWEKYSSSMNDSWTKSQEKRGNPKMIEWRDAELKQKDTTTLFYPFSGPDFLNAFTFFHMANKYVMLALEPVGTVPDFSKVPADSLGRYFNEIKNSLTSILNFSFFRTNSMSKDFHSDELNGTIPVLFVFLERTGNRIIDVHPIQIDSLGNIIPSEFVQKVPKGKTNYGVQIDFKNPDNDYLQTVYYFSCDLSNGRLKNNPGMIKFLANINNVTTYLKSASCLMFHSSFSQIRDAIIAHSNLVLQDDSGIPYKYFDKAKWDIKLYGKYIKPIALFKDDFQKDLREAYKADADSIKKLQFGIGYNFTLGESNLMIARKK